REAHGLFEQRIERGNERLNGVIQHMRKADGPKHREDRVLRGGHALRLQSGFRVRFVGEGRFHGVTAHTMNSPALRAKPRLWHIRPFQWYFSRISSRNSAGAHFW